MALAEVVFEVQAPGALGRFTKEHPEARAVLRFTSLGEEPRALITIAGPTEQTSTLVKELREELRGGEFEILSITPYSVVVRAAASPHLAPWAAPAARFVEVFGRDTMLEPALVEQGRLRVKGMAAQSMDTRGALERLQELQAAGKWEGFRVVHVSAFDPKAFGDRAAPLLEPEQEDLLRLALVMGYYDTPRRCNLEDIAGRVGLSVSPVHKKLKEVEHTLIYAHLEPDAPRVPRRRRQSRARPPPAAPLGLMREVMVRLQAPGFLPAAFTGRNDARVVYQPLADAPGTIAHLFVVLARAEAAQAFDRAVREDPELVEVEELSRDQDHVSLKVRRRPAEGAAGLGQDPLAALVGALGRDAYAKPALCEGGAVVARVVVLRKLGEEELDALLQELAQAQGWREAELLGVKDMGVETALMTRGKTEKLTGRQEEVLRIAHALGYYRTPRGCTLEDVATTLGVSANAVHKNLTSAEQRIIQGYVNGGLPL